jgi:hypothetical protein
MRQCISCQDAPQRASHMTASDQTSMKLHCHSTIPYQGMTAGTAVRRQQGLHMYKPGRYGVSAAAATSAAQHGTTILLSGQQHNTTAPMPAARFPACWQPHSAAVLQRHDIKPCPCRLSGMLFTSTSTAASCQSHCCEAALPALHAAPPPHSWLISQCSPRIPTPLCFSCIQRAICSLHPSTMRA